ncbi:hypothetical protein D3C83_125660 [compost metagenome]
MIGPVAAVVAGGFGVVTVVVLVGLVWPELRRLGPLARSPDLAAEHGGEIVGGESVPLEEEPGAIGGQP